MRKDLSKTKDVTSELTKQHDALKRKYAEDVEQLKTVSADENNSRTERISDLESLLKGSEE